MQIPIELVKRQVLASHQARLLISQEESIPGFRLISCSEHRLDGIYIQLKDIETKQTYDLRYCNQTKILERWKHQQNTMPHRFLPKQIKENK